MHGWQGPFLDKERRILCQLDTAADTADIRCWSCDRVGCDEEYDALRNMQMPACNALDQSEMAYGCVQLLMDSWLWPIAAARAPCGANDSAQLSLLMHRSVAEGSRTHAPP